MFMRDLYSFPSASAILISFTILQCDYDKKKTVRE